MGTLREDFTRGVESALQEEGGKMISALVDEVDSRGITNQGGLRQNFRQAVEMSGMTGVLRITGVSYANAVAEGTSPGYWPPRANIRRWVETKLKPPDNDVWRSVQTVMENINAEGTPTSNSPLSGGKNDYVKGALDRRLPKLTDLLEAKVARATQ